MTQFPNNVSTPFVESSLREWRENQFKINLIGSKCKKCNKYSFPREFVCSNCHATKLVNYKFNPFGKISNFIIEGIPQISVMGFEKRIPRIIAMIELEKKVNIVAEVTDIIDVKDLSIGDEVSLIVRKMPRLSNGMDNYAYKFKKINNKKINNKKEFSLSYSFGF